MTTVSPSTWQEANHRHLMAAIATIQAILLLHSGESVSPTSAQPDDPPSSPAASDRETPPALDYLCHCFGLSAFERDIVLLCAGMELGSTWGDLCAAAAKNHQPYPTFDLAQQILAAPHWSAFLPQSPLRHWQILELGPSHSLLAAPLRLSERILHHLLGFAGLDHRLTDLVTPLPAPDSLVPSHQQLVAHITRAWQSPASTQPLPLIQLCGSDYPSLQSIACAACDGLGIIPYHLHHKALPPHPPELQQFTRLWQREGILGQVALIIDGDPLSPGEATQTSGIDLLLETLNGPLILLSRDRRTLSHRPLLTYDIHTPSRQEQISLWHHHLGSQVEPLNGYIPTLAGQFDLNSHQIHSASLQALAGIAHPNPEVPQEPLPQLLWQACRVQTRPQLDDLAQRLTPGERWQDLVLPDLQQAQLQEIVAHVRQRAQVYETWGFGQRSNRGLGISALFAGTSGTGKTMAAGVLAQTLQLDLYRIDLSAVVSKYIGETEKNLRRVFDAAESGGVVLLFDEADALFGKRSDVKDSHDRYANMEVSYLLQRMEAYRGLAILTTNMKDAIDPAFMRRIRFVVSFPFPDYAQRLAIWQHIFPAAVPTQALNYKQLAKLNVAGGNIRNIALTAAFLAADEGQPVTMDFLLSAAQREFAKLERALPLAEVKGWGG